MKKETVQYLVDLELRIRACETKIDLLREEAFIGEEARQTECLHTPEIRSDGMLVCGCGVELGHIDRNQEQQLAASPYLVDEIPPECRELEEEPSQGIWADLDPDLGKPTE